MKNLNHYIFEKLKINKDTKITSSFERKANDLVKYLGDKLIRSNYEHSKHILWIKHDEDTSSIIIQIHKDAKRSECQSISGYVIWMLELCKFCDHPDENTVYLNRDTYTIDINLFDLIK